MKNLLTTALMALCVLFPQVARATCETPTHVSQLSEAWRIAEVAFAQLDAEALFTQASRARADILPCVAEPLTKKDAAAFHRLMAMEAFIGGNYTRVTQELHASFLLESDYTFPADVAGEGHPLLTLYRKAQKLSNDVDGEDIHPPLGGYVLTRGERNKQRYPQIPVIVQAYQVVGDVDMLRETRYVQPGEATPNWSGNVFGLTAADFGIDLDDLRRPSILKNSRPWYIAAGSTVIVSGVLYGIALQQKGVYQDPSTHDDQLDELESRVNGLGTASLITGGTAVIFTGFGLGFHMKFGPGHRPIINPHKEEVASP